MRHAAAHVELYDHEWEAQQLRDGAAALEYYKAGMLKQAPPWVPCRVRVLRDQYGDPPFRGSGVPAGEHDCQCNKWGAVSVTARDGKLLGLRLDEFEPLAWRENLQQLRCPACDSTLIDDADEGYPADADEPMTVGLDCCPHQVPYGSDCDECDEDDADMEMGLTQNV